MLLLRLVQLNYDKTAFSFPLVIDSYAIFQQAFPQQSYAQPAAAAAPAQPPAAAAAVPQQYYGAAYY